MYDLAIFTEEIALGLIERGFELICKTEKAWYFKDSVSVRSAVRELMDDMQ